MTAKKYMLSGSEREELIKYTRVVLTNEKMADLMIAVRPVYRGDSFYKFCFGVATKDIAVEASPWIELPYKIYNRHILGKLYEEVQNEDEFMNTENYKPKQIRTYEELFNSEMEKFIDLVEEILNTDERFVQDIRCI